MSLKFHLNREAQDQDQGLLSAQATGDIDGTITWRIHGTLSGLVVADFDQRVTLCHRVARTADIAIRPLLTWNHAVAMRSGQAGLLRFLQPPTDVSGS